MNKLATSLHRNALISTELTCVDGSACLKTALQNHAIKADFLTDSAEPFNSPSPVRDQKSKW